MPNKNLVNFIKESRKRGFDDFQIREPLLKHGWPESEIERAFDSLKLKIHSQVNISLHLDPEVIKKIEKRAQKNLFTLEEQVEDILRRSTINMRKKTPQEEKLDDKFVAFFSRKK